VEDMSFIDFAKSYGLVIDQAKFYPSDFIKRCGTVEKPRSQNGSYLWDGQRGWIFDWGEEAKVIWYNDPYAKPWTDEEKQAWAVKRQAQQSEQQRRYDQVALQADIVLRSAKSAIHSYLQIKGFNDLEGLVMNDKLLIPMRNVTTNKLQGYQEIYWDAEARKHEKKMLLGMRAKNAVFYIGDRQSEEVWLVEGYATGLSLHHALRSCGLKASVVVCFSASNLIAVADQIKGNRFVFADNDESKTGEKAAISTGLPWVMADTVGWDANDLHLKQGLFAVVAKIIECKKRVLTSTE
jgi:putative DNA primase/helicase